MNKAELIRVAERQGCKSEDWNLWEVTTAKKTVRSRKTGELIVEQGKQYLVESNSARKQIDHPTKSMKNKVFVYVYSPTNLGGIVTSVEVSALNFKPSHVEEKSWLD